MNLKSNQVRVMQSEEMRSATFHQTETLPYIYNEGEFEEEEMKKIRMWAGAAAAMLGVQFLFNMNQLCEKIQVVVDPVIHHSTQREVKIKFDLAFKNLTGETVRIKQPSLSVEHNHKVLSFSQNQERTYKIPKQGQIKVDPIFIDLPVALLNSIVPDVAKELRRSGLWKAGKTKLLANVKCEIESKIPYHSQKEFTI